LVVLASLATLLTIALLVWTLRSTARQKRPAAPARRDRRRPHVGGKRDPREALALVGNALAATHDPQALLPVILEVLTEATGARGGRLLQEGEEAAWIGDVNSGAPASTFALGAAVPGETTTLELYAPPSGFDADTLKLADWLASQAAIALENARLHHIIQRQAITDELTGLVNRRRFMEALPAEVTRATTLDSPLSAVLADLDDFKLVNDRFGHHVGDEVLKGFADLASGHLRDIDVLGRLGGEEFAILLPETDIHGAASVADRIRRSLGGAPLAVVGEEPVTMTASFGVSELEPNQSGDDLLRGADAALYRAKEAGKNRVALAESLRHP
jgi:diguanylate cyclase (GGDEF)-like protein